MRQALTFATAQGADDLRRDIERLGGIELPLQWELQAAETIDEFVDEHRTIVILVGIEQLAHVAAGDQLELRRGGEKGGNIRAMIDIAVLREEFERHLPQGRFLHPPVDEGAIPDRDPGENIVGLGGNAHESPNW